MSIYAKPNTTFFPNQFLLTILYLLTDRPLPRLDWHLKAIFHSLSTVHPHYIQAPQVPKPPTYSFFSSPNTPILVHTSTNSYSNYWDRLNFPDLQFLPHQIYPIRCHLDTFKTINKQVIYKFITSSSDFTSSSTHISAYLMYLYSASFTCQMLTCLKLNSWLLIFPPNPTPTLPIPISHSHLSKWHLYPANYLSPKSGSHPWHFLLPKPPHSL